MLYELHLTTKPETDDFEWQDVCQEIGVKPLRIDLAGGNPRNPVQLMTASTHEGDDGSAYAWRHGLIAELGFRGHSVIRAKLEVPLDKSEPYEHPAYHEAHVKALIPKEHLHRFLNAGERLGWMMSVNMFYPVEMNLAKVYFTARAYDTDYRAAAAVFQSRFSRLSFDMPFAVRMEMETVVMDNNPELDEGWN